MKFGIKKGNRYQKIKEAYIIYLGTYKALNNGSLAGATHFSTFFERRTYFDKYSDNAAFSIAGFS